MSIPFLDRIQSLIPTTIIEGKDVSDVLLINPDPNLPNFFLVNKAVLRTASKEIDVYDSDGNLEHTIDINETDLTAINQAIADVDGRVDETNSELEKNVAALNIEVKANFDLATLANNTADEAKGLASNAISASSANAGSIDTLNQDLEGVSATLTGFDQRITENADDVSDTNDLAQRAHNLATSAQTEAALNTTNIAALDVISTNQTKNIKELQARTDKQSHDIKNVKRKARSNQLSVDTLEAQMDRQITKNERQDGEIANVQAYAESNEANLQILAEDTDSKFTLTGEKFDAIDATIEAMGTTIDENNAALESKIGEMDADRDVIRGSLEATQADVTIIQDELAIEGLGGLYRQGTDIETASISSNGSGFIDELYIPPDPDTVDVGDKPQPIGGTYQYHVVNENGSYTKLLSFDKDGLDMSGRQIVNVASGQNIDDNAANIADVKRLIEDSPDNGLVPTDNKWDMDALPIVNAGSIGFNDQISSSSDGASYARFTTGSLELGAEGQIYFEVDGVTVGDVNRTRANFAGSGSVLGKNTPEDGRSPYELINWETLQAYPDNGLVPTNNVWNMTGYPLTNVLSVGHKTDRTGARVGFEEYRANILADTIRFVTQNDSGEYGNISSTGLELNDLEIKGVRESSTETSAATVGQVNAVHAKVDGLTIPADLSVEVAANTSEISNVKTTATAADTLSKANKAELDALVIPPDLSTQVSANTDSISAVDAKVDALDIPADNSAQVTQNTADIAAVKTTADTADALSKANQTAIENLGGAPNLDEYAKLDDEVQFTKVNLKNDFGNDTKNPYLWCDPANGNTDFSATGSVYFNRYDQEGNKSRYALVDTSNRVILDNPTKVSRLNNANTWTTHSENDKAAFIRFDVDNKLVHGAKESIDFQVNGKNVYKVKEDGIDFTGQGDNVSIAHDNNIDIKIGGVNNVAFKNSGMRFLRDVDGNNHTISNMGDLKFNSNYQIEGKSENNLKVRNAGGVYGNLTDDKTSVRFNGNDVKYKATHHQYYANDSSSQIFGVSSSGANLFNHNVLNVKHLLGNSAGTMNVAGVSVIKRDDASDNTNSIHFNSGNLTAFSDKHEWKTNDNARRLTIENHAADWHECQLKNITDATDDKDVPSFKQLKTIVSTKWFEIVTGDLASDGSRPTGSGSDTNLNVWHNTVSASTTNPVNELKIDSADAVKEALSWANPLRYKLVQGDKVQYWEADSNGWSTSTSVWHLSATKVSGDDLTVGEETVVYASFLEESDGGNSPLEMDGFKKYVQPNSPVTYYAHQGDSHLYIEYSGNGGTVSLDTMRMGSDQTEDMVVFHNITPVESSIRLFFNGSSVNHTVPPKSYLQGWANREMGRWATVIAKDASEVPDNLIIKHTDLSWSTSSDPRENTKRMIAAAPNMCTIIGRHVANGSAKEKIVSVGATNKVETQTSVFVINKHSSGHATGICTSEESSGKTWSRILDGTRGSWFTNESANSRMLSSDIDPADYPENQLFFTTDKGLMETYIIDDSGEIGLRELEGYNVPEQGQEIEQLKSDRDANTPITKYFKNESVVTVPYTQDHPVAEVFVLDTTKTIDGGTLSLVDDNTHKYSGVYNTVGSISITANKWTSYSYHNAFKHTSENYYVVYDFDLLSWVIVEANTPHTSLNEDISSVEKISLQHRGQLPESYGDYNINLSIEDLDSLEFIRAEANTRIDTDAKVVIADFGQSKPSGKLIIS